MGGRGTLGVGDTSDTDHGFLQRSCSNCGNSFCSRCCSFKVPKSSMGATGEWGRRPGVRALGGLGWFLHLPRAAAVWKGSKGPVRRQGD